MKLQISMNGKSWALVDVSEIVASEGAKIAVNGREFKLKERVPPANGLYEPEKWLVE